MKGIMKKSIAVIIALVLAVGTPVITPFAATTNFAVKLDKDSCLQGEEITAEIYFPSSFNKVASFEMSLIYDKDVLTVSSVTVGKGLLTAMDKQKNGEVYSCNKNNPGYINWALAGGNNYEFSGTFAVVAFRVKNTAEQGDTDIQLQIKNAANSGRVDITSSITASGAKLTVFRNLVYDMTFSLNSEKTGYLIKEYNYNGLSDIIIPSENKGLPIVGIEKDAFANHTELQSVVLPTELEYIGDGAFEDCTNLKEIAIPDNVTRIKKNAFRGCENLKTVSLPLGLLSIEQNAFADCSALTSVEIPFTVTSLGIGAFRRCKALKEVKISKNTQINYNAFAGCGDSFKFIAVADASNVTSYIKWCVMDADIVTVKDISLGTATAQEDYDYTGSEIIPTVEVTLENGETVELGKDYKIVCHKNTKVGTAKYYVVGIDGYGEGYAASFSITCKHPNAEKELVKAATCNEAGLYSCNCGLCGESYDEVIPQKSHTTKSTWKILTRPTIYTEGSKCKTCLVCKQDCEITAISKVYPDVNGDGFINSSDALLVLQYSVGDKSIIKTDELFMNVDTNGDGNVNSSDALAILQIAVGMVEI